MTQSISNNSYSPQKSQGTTARLSRAPHLHQRCRTCVGHSCRHSLRPPCCSVFIFLGSFDTAFHYSGGTPPRLSSSLISTGIIVSCDCCFYLSFPPFSTKKDFGRTLTAFRGPDGKPCDECHDIVFDRSSPSSTWSSEVEVHLPIYKTNM